MAVTSSTSVDNAVLDRAISILRISPSPDKSLWQQPQTDVFENVF